MHLNRKKQTIPELCLNFHELLQKNIKIFLKLGHWPHRVIDPQATTSSSRAGSEPYQTRRMRLVGWCTGVLYTSLYWCTVQCTVHQYYALYSTSLENNEQNWCTIHCSYSKQKGVNFLCLWHDGDIRYSSAYYQVNLEKTNSKAVSQSFSYSPLPTASTGTVSPSSITAYTINQLELRPLLLII